MTINRERSIDTLLLEWKNSRSLKSLLLRGARQVGKSWAVEHLGESFDYFIEVNFEKRPDMKDVFEKVHDVHELAKQPWHSIQQTCRAWKDLDFSR